MAEAFCGIIAAVHELSVTQSILDIAQRHAEQAGARRITAGSCLPNARRLRSWSNQLSVPSRLGK